MTELLKTAAGFVWGPWLLIPLLLATGVVLTVRLRGLQFTQLGPALYLALITRREPGAEGDVSHFQSLMTALAATVGTGNIVGVATAIALGGPGALFWMWVTGLVGMATKYSEAVLSVKYRIVDERGDQAGGPMYFLERGLRWRFLGKSLAVCYALFTAVAAFGIGNMVQANSVSAALENAFSVPPAVSGLSLVVALAAVLFGGIRSIGKVSSFLVPAMIAFYLLACTVVLAAHAEAIPAAFALVFSDAFTGTAATGGFTGAALSQAIRFGVARGIFSNESGLGSAGIAAAAAQTHEPASQGLVSMTQTFIDTIIVCSFTGLAIIASGAWSEGENGAALTQLAFSSAFPDALGKGIIALALPLFAFSTILGWGYYGGRSIAYMFGARAVLPYRVLFVGAVFWGAIDTLEFVWTFSDLMNGLMALPNLVGLLLLAGVVVRETEAFLNRRDVR